MVVCKAPRFPPVLVRVRILRLFFSFIFRAFSQVCARLVYMREGPACRCCTGRGCRRNNEVSRCSFCPEVMDDLFTPITGPPGTCSQHHAVSPLHYGFLGFHAYSVHVGPKLSDALVSPCSIIVDVGFCPQITPNRGVHQWTGSLPRLRVFLSQCNVKRPLELVPCKG